MTSWLSALEEVLALSEQMVRAAKASDWQELTNLEDRRRALASQLPDDLGQRFPPEESARARRLLEDCRRCDGEVRPLVVARLNELRTLLRQPAAAV
jgi:flagellar protein FliT